MKTDPDFVSFTENIKGFIQRYYLHLLIVASTCLRILIVVNGGRSLFDSGQDAPSYEASAFDFVRKGFWSSEISYLPVWPAGYPSLLALFIMVFDESWWKFVVAFQHAFYLISGYYFLKQLKSIISNLQHIVLSLLILFLPSLIYSASENMYESILASLMMLGIAASIAVFTTNPSDFPWKSYGIAIFSFGLAGFIQARTAPMGILILLFVAQKLNVKTVFLAFLSSWGIILTMLRSWIAYKFYSPSINFSIALGVSGTKFESCSFAESAQLSFWQNAAKRDRELTMCYLDFFVRNPSEFFSHVLREGRHLYGPLNGGGVQGASTWFHGLDFKRLLGFFGLQISETVNVVQNSYAILLNLAILFGAFFVLKRLPWQIVLTLFSPIVINTIIHVVSNGDSRYRLPFLPLQMVFLSYCIADAYKCINRGRKSLDKHSQSSI